MAEQATIWVKLGLKKDSFESRLKGSIIQLFALHKVIQLSSAAFKGFFRAMGKASVAASDVEESMNLMGLVFGKSKKEVMEWSTELAEATGRSRFEIAGMATEFQAVLGPMLKSKEAAKGLSQGLAKLAIDVSSARNMPEKMALEKLRAGIVGEIEPLRSLGVVMSVANLQAFAMAEGNHKLIQKMTEGEKVALRYKFIMEGMAAIQNDAANTSQAFANRLRTVKAIHSDLLILIGQNLVPTFNLFLGKIIDLGNALLRNKDAMRDLVKAGLILFIDKSIVLFKTVGFILKVMAALRVVSTGAFLAMFTAIDSTLPLLDDSLKLLVRIARVLDLVSVGVSWAPLLDSLSGLVTKAREFNGELEAGAQIKLAEDLADFDKLDKGLTAGIEGFKKLGEAGIATFGILRTADAEYGEEKDERNEKDNANLDERISKQLDLQEKVIRNSVRMGAKVGEVFHAATQGHEALENATKSAMNTTLDMLRDLVIKEITMNAAAGATAAGKSVAGIPIVGPALAAGAAASVFALLKGFLSKMHTGGVVTKDNLLNLPGMAADEGLTMLQEGETVLPRGGGGGGGVTVEYNTVFPQTRAEIDAFVDSALVPALKRRKIAGAF